MSATSSPTSTVPHGEPEPAVSEAVPIALSVVGSLLALVASIVAWVFKDTAQRSEARADANERDIKSLSERVRQLEIRTAEYSAHRLSDATQLSQLRSEVTEFRREMRDELKELSEALHKSTRGRDD